MINFFRKNHSLIIIIFFAAVLFSLSLLDVVTPDRTYSDTENRQLSSAPKLTFKTLVDGKYSSDYEEYINDQFILRDFWIDVKSYTESLLGKTENNGIVYGKNGYMFEKYYSVSDRRIKNNLNFINQFTAEYAVDTTVVIVPNSYMILADKLPKGLENADQQPYIDEIYSSLDSAKGLDVAPVLSEHSDEYIYYRTDHHYTTYGAYLVYCEYMESIGEEPASLETFTANEAADFYGTHFSKTKYHAAQPDVITYYDIPGKEVTVNNQPVDGIYDTEKFSQRDKYAAFLHGNNSLTVIRSTEEKENPTRLLLIKDSFGNEIAPFLSASFDEVYIVDPRYTEIPLSSVMEEVEFDRVLILYNFMNFAQDTNVINITN